MKLNIYELVISNFSQQFIREKRINTSVLTCFDFWDIIFCDDFSFQKARAKGNHKTLFDLINWRFLLCYPYFDILLCCSILQYCMCDWWMGRYIFDCFLTFTLCYSCILCCWINTANKAEDLLCNFSSCIIWNDWNYNQCNIFWYWTLLRILSLWRLSWINDWYVFVFSICFCHYLLHCYFC